MLESSSVSEPQPQPTPPPKQPPGDCIGAVSTLMTLVLASGMVLTLVGGRYTRTCGSTRSARLEFQRKQAERLAEMEGDQAPAVPLGEMPMEANP